MLSYRTSLVGPERISLGSDREREKGEGTSVGKKEGGKVDPHKIYDLNP